MPIKLLDGTLTVEVFYETQDKTFEDNICMRIMESCPDEERVFRAEENNLYLTPQEACELAQALREAAKCSQKNHSKG